MNAGSRYLCVWGVSLLITLLVLGGVNWCIDPLALFQPKDVIQLAAGYERKVKPWQVIDKQPTTILIGNSRNYHSSWVGRFAEQSYNFSVPGATMTEQLRAFEHSLYHAPVQHVLLAADYICDAEYSDGLEHYSSNAYEFAASQLSRAGYLLSFETLKKSIRALFEKGATTILLQDDGSRAFFPYHSIGQTQRQRIEKREGIRVLRGVERQHSGSKIVKTCSTTSLESFITLAHEANVKLTIFINPQHARYVWLSTLFGGNLYGQRMKQIIVELNQKLAGKYGVSPPVIYDCQVYDRFTTERMRADRDSELWWETSHFKPKLGHMMMSQMLHKHHALGSFCVPLDEKSLQSVLDKQARDYNTWVEDNPDVIDDMRAKVAAVSKEGS